MKTPTTSSGGRTAITYFFLLVALVLGIWYARQKYAEYKVVSAEKAKTATTPAASNAGARERPTGVIYATTPATMTLDFEFNLESDAPINVKYPGEKPVLYVPGKGFQQLPQPRHSGPKVFTDPKDPNGHVAFRIYPIR